MSRLNFQRRNNIFNFLNNSISIPINQSEVNAQAAARAEYEINVTIEQESKFYFLTYNGIYHDNFIDYRKGIKLFNKFLCQKTFFNSDTIQYDDYYFNNSFENVINEIYEEYSGIEKNKVASMINFNLQDVYKLLTSRLYLDDYINPDNNIGEPNLSIFNTIMEQNKNNKIPVYISWGNISPKMVYLKDLNYIQSGSTDDDRITNGDYLINFGPCYFDELFRLNLIINDLNIDGNVYQQLDTKNQINTINFTDTTIYYLIIDGDYYNNALRFFYNYAKNLTIINLISRSNQKTTETFNMEEIPDHKVTNENGSRYRNYINEIYNTKQTFEFNRPNLSNVSDQITNFPNVVLINIPSAENNNDLNEHYLGKAINKSFDIMKKHFNNDLTDPQKDKSYIYIKTESFEGEKALIETLNDLTNYGTGIEETFLTSQSNKYFLNEKKVILSSYNNIEYSLKKYKKEKKSSLSRLENCRILSSYNLNTSKQTVDYINKLEVSFYSSPIENFEPKANQSFTINTLDQNLSYQQINKAILECTLFFYISIIDITYNKDNKNNLKNESTGSNVNYYKIEGERIYKIYIKYLDLFLIENSYINSPIFNTIFGNLLSKYNSIINNENNNDYEKYIESNKNWKLGMDNILNNGLKKHNFRIRTFELYIFNNEDNFIYDYDNNLSVYTDCDNFESAISSVFYEYVLLKNIQLNSGSLFNLQDIFDDVNSILIKSDNLSELMYYSPNLHFKFNNLTNVTISFNSNNLSDLITKDIEKNFQVDLIDSNQNGSFEVVVELQNVKNIYNNNYTFNLYSNTITINIEKTTF